MRVKSSKTLALRICLILVSLVIVFLLLEGLVRMLHLQKIVRLNPAIYEKAANPVISYELKPHYTGKAYGAQVRTNAMGMHDRDRSLEKPPGIMRIALVGDSMVFGFGVPMEQNLAAQLEQALNRAPEDKEFEVLNFGVPGYNTEQEAEVVRTKVLAFHPDLIALVFVDNDFDPTFRLNKNNYFVTEEQMKTGQMPAAEKYDKAPGLKRWLDQHSCLYRFLRIRYAHLAAGLGLRLPERDVPEPACAGDTEASRRLWEKARAHFLEMRDLAVSTGAAFMIIEWQYNRGLQGRATRILREFCAQNRILFLDMAPVLLNRPGGYKPLSLGWDSHPGEAGYEAAAQAIAQFIREKLS